VHFSHAPHGDVRIQKRAMHGQTVHKNGTVHAPSFVQGRFPNEVDWGWPNNIPKIKFGLQRHGRQTPGRPHATTLPMRGAGSPEPTTESSLGKLRDAVGQETACLLESRDLRTVDAGNLPAAQDAENLGLAALLQRFRDHTRLAPGSTEAASA